MIHPFQHRSLGEILIERAFAKRADVEAALTQGEAQLGEVLLRNHSVRPEHLAQALATPGREVAKSVLIRADHNYRYIVAVLPAAQADLAGFAEMWAANIVGQAWLEDGILDVEPCPF